MIKENDKVLLLGERNFLVTKKQKKMGTQFGELDLTKIKKYGQMIKSSLGEEFFVVEPTVIDLLRKCNRLPQIITTKDAAQIIAVTGLTTGMKCLDAGTGSAFLTIFLGNIVKPNGSVISYEKNKRFYDNAKKNIAFCSMEKVITIKNKDMLKGFSEKNLDLITLDMIYAEELVSKAHAALKPGGWLCIYSPHIEQQKKSVVEMEKLFRQIKTIETMQRLWQVSDYTHPMPRQIVHTGFISFGRKVYK